MSDVVNDNVLEELLYSEDIVYKNVPVGSYVSLQKDEEKFEDICKKIINHTSLVMKQMAEASFKSHPYLEPSDIEQIKANLEAYKKKNKRVNKFKDNLISDLSDFQKQIRLNHAQKIRILKNEKDFIERQMKVLEYSKTKLIMSRLANVQWPYDAKTKDFDKKIEVLQLKAKKHSQKIEEAQGMRPAASLKEILIYQMQMKEKYNIQ